MLAEHLDRACRLVQPRQLHVRPDRQPTNHDAPAGKKRGALVAN
jgi:hypothetical protein